MGGWALKTDQVEHWAWQSKKFLLQNNVNGLLIFVRKKV